MKTLLILLLLLAAPPAIAAEARCVELGSACVCSEPMNVNDGPIIKRGRERARGMYAPIRKRMSHISVRVSTVEEPTESNE